MSQASGASATLTVMKRAPVFALFVLAASSSAHAYLPGPNACNEPFLRSVGLQNLACIECARPLPRVVGRTARQGAASSSGPRSVTREGNRPASAQEAPTVPEVLSYRRERRTSGQFLAIGVGSSAAAAPVAICHLREAKSALREFTTG